MPRMQNLASNFSKIFQGRAPRPPSFAAFNQAAPFLRAVRWACCAMEMAEQEVRDLHQNTSQSVHAVYSGNAAHSNTHPKKEQSPCYLCGAKHLSTPANARLPLAITAKASSPLFARPTKIRDTNKETPLTKTTHQLQAEDNMQVSQYTMFYTPSSRSDPILVKVTLNEVDHTMEVDTGATLSIIVIVQTIRGNTVGLFQP